jgi:hypothetical protein
MGVMGYEDEMRGEGSKEVKKRRGKEAKKKRNSVRVRKFCEEVWVEVLRP